MGTLPGLLSGKLNFKFVINSKTDFSGVQKRKKMHIDSKFDIFRLTYASDVRTFQVVKIFFPKFGVHKIAKKTCGTELNDTLKIFERENSFMHLPIEICSSTLNSLIIIGNF